MKKICTKIIPVIFLLIFSIFGYGLSQQIVNAQTTPLKETKELREEIFDRLVIIKAMIPPSFLEAGLNRPSPITSSGVIISVNKNSRAIYILSVSHSVIDFLMNRNKLDFNSKELKISVGIGGKDYSEVSVLGTFGLSDVSLLKLVLQDQEFKEVVDKIKTIEIGDGVEKFEDIFIAGFYSGIPIFSGGYFAEVYPVVLYEDINGNKTQKVVGYRLIFVLDRMIAPGMSGGLAFNKNKELIGILTQMLENVGGHIAIASPITFTDWLRETLKIDSLAVKSDN